MVVQDIISDNQYSIQFVQWKPWISVWILHEFVAVNKEGGLMDFPRATHVKKKKKFFQVILTFLTSATTLQGARWSHLSWGRSDQFGALRQNSSPGVLPSCCSSLSLVFCTWFLSFRPNEANFLYLFFILLLYLCICHGPYHHVGQLLLSSVSFLEEL